MSFLVVVILLFVLHEYLNVADMIQFDITFVCIQRMCVVDGRLNAMRLDLNRFVLQMK